MNFVIEQSIYQTYLLPQQTLDKTLTIKRSYHKNEILYLKYLIVENIWCISSKFKISNLELMALCLSDSVETTTIIVISKNS